MVTLPLVLALHQKGLLGIEKNNWVEQELHAYGKPCQSELKD
jgi:hypothetical protein